MTRTIFRSIILAGVAAAAPTHAAADLVIRNARVHTMDAASGHAGDGGSLAEAVCVTGSVITAVGSNAASAACVGPATRVIDAGGRLLLPGFMDSHIHAIGGARTDVGINLSLADTPEKLAAALVALRDASPGSGAINARGWQNHLFGPQGPTSAALDAIFGDRVVILASVDGHSTWFSSRALRDGGASAATPDSEPGISFFERDARTGALLGTAREGAGGFIVDKLIARAPSDYEAAFVRWLPAAAEAGLTGVFDAGMGAPTEADAYDLLARLETSGRLTLRMFTSTGDRGDGVDSHGDDPVARLVALRRAHRGALLRPTAVKLYADGVPEGHTAFLLAPYRDRPGFAGKPMMTPDYIYQRLVAGEKAGVPMHVHAIGGGAVREVLDAVARVRAETPGGAGAAKPGVGGAAEPRVSGAAEPLGQRHTIAHMDLVDAADIPRFARLGVVAQTSAQWATRDPSFDNIAGFVGVPAMTAAYPLHSLIAAGAIQSLGTDWPAASYLSTYKPLTQIEVAVTRRLPGRRDLPPRNPAEALTVAEAVKALTGATAWQVGAEDRLGSIAAGKQADLILLDRDIFTVDPFTIAEGSALLTIVDGRIVRDALP